MLEVKIDSRKVVKGDTFVAIKGSVVDGHDYVLEAIGNGAKRVVLQDDLEIDVGVEKVLVADTLVWLSDYVVSHYSDEVNEMNILGITGTNGKTTSAYLTYQMLNRLSSKTAYIGTIGFYIEGEEVVELPNTTPNILDLYEFLLRAKVKGCRNVIMEVSSHALSLERVKGLRFKVAAFTNLTQDHLDYHGSMENYLECKKLILKQTVGTFIVNSDDRYASCFEFDNKKSLGYSGSDYRIIDYEDKEEGTSIRFENNSKEYIVETNLKSNFNVYNYLTALGIVNGLGYGIEEIIGITSSIYPPKGRCEQIKVGGGMAIIDYAHTPDAVEKIIKAFKENKKGKIITVIGCGGDRDPLKRPIMGKIASDNSDYVIYTNDNPRTENPEKIMDDILAGVDGSNYEVIYDRGEAIKRGLDLTNDNDILLILGKGHEDYQIIGRTKIYFDDAEVVREYINCYNQDKKIQ